MKNIFKLNIATIVDVTRDAIMRFPIAIAFVCALTAAFIYMVNVEDYYGVLTYYLSAGVLMSLMFHLWIEEASKPRIVMTFFVISHILLALDAYLLHTMNDNEYSIAVYMARVAVFVAFLLGIFNLPFIKNNDDVEAYSFTRQFIINGVGAWIVCGILTAGLIILFEGVLTLFGIDISYTCHSKIVASIFIVFMQFLPTVITISRIPKGADKHDRNIASTKFGIGVLRYLFIPLILLYVVVLYAYLGKIIMAWQLPNGTVSTMVSVMMFGLILVNRMLYPTIVASSSNRFEKFIIRYLPMLVIPLVALMSVGIFRRLSDYGITANRLYMLTLNGWFYVVCFGLIITKSRRINWIELLFGVLLILSSAHPLNYNEIARRVMNTRIAEAVVANPSAEMPFKNRNDLRVWLESLPDSSGVQVLGYMQNITKCGYNSDLYAIVDTNLYFSYMTIFDDINNEYQYDNSVAIVDVAEDKFAKIPHSYNYVNSYYSSEIFCSDSVMCGNDTILVYLYIDRDRRTCDTIKVALHKEQLKKMSLIETTTTNGERIALQPTQVEIRNSNGWTKIRLEGFSFSK